MSGVVIVLSLMLFIYPAVTICTLVVTDSQSADRPAKADWFRCGSSRPRRRFLSWANTYLETNYAQSLDHDDIPATEWPMFGAVFFLVTAEELQKRGKIDATQGTIREAVEKAAADRRVAGDRHLGEDQVGRRLPGEENVFYRMLLILGLSSYERITGDTQYHALMSQQRTTLAEELAEAKLHLRDDYPSECYPADMLVGRRGDPACGTARRHADHDELARSLIAAFDGPLKAPEGLPAFQAESRRAGSSRGARLRKLGHPPVCRRTGPGGRRPLVRRLRSRTSGKTPAGSPASRKCRADRNEDLMDVDSGPVLCGVGSVASAFGIGAAKTAGRCDHAAPLTHGGRRLLVADAFWLPGSRPDGPPGRRELESGRGCAAVLDDQTHVGGRNRSLSRVLPPLIVWIPPGRLYEHRPVFHLV